MKTMFRIALASAMVIGAATAAQASDSIQYNTAPSDTFYYGSGNDYTPANAAVLTTDAGDQLSLRFHKTFETAPASDGSGVYSFALGTEPMSFDWGIDAGLAAGGSVSALITLTNLGTGATFSYDPFYIGNDDEYLNGSAENSFRLEWAPIGFDPNVNDTYQVNLTYNDATGAAHSLDIFAKLGTGAVPEPATWAMIVGGFGLLGFATRRRSAAKSVTA
jgi:hypothetical protein